VMQGLESAFAYFGAVPRELLFDQMKAVVLEDHRHEGGALLHNAEFARFAAHWRFRIRACRPYRARTKGKVERPIRYVRESFFYARDFVGDEDLNAQALSWLEGTANVRCHATLKVQPRERFELERGVLQPLANHPYRSLVASVPALTARLSSNVQLPSVERRPLSSYAQLVHS